jgi:5-methylcytosine-specific restriction endonuclease McrA
LPNKDWTPKNIRSKVKGELRRRWLWHWEPRRAALNAARIGPNAYLCARCKKVFTKNQVEVDHINPVAEKGDNSWQWIERLFAPNASDYQVLCKHNCHIKKTGGK